jgi:TPR repeat protein
MRTGILITFALLLATSLVAAQSLEAQSLEERMRTAAGAYERKDYATAVAIWRPLAAQGNAEAETLLGAMYWSGEGVPRNHAEAAKLYLRAAEQGYARAQNDIGFMYGFGEGTPPRNDVQAYKWISLAIMHYTAKNQDRLDQAIQDRATLKARMSAAQIAEAERLVRDWKAVP